MRTKTGTIKTSLSLSREHHPDVCSVKAENLEKESVTAAYIKKRQCVLGHSVQFRLRQGDDLPCGQMTGTSTVANWSKFQAILWQSFALLQLREHLTLPTCLR